jgi:uncharacterized lipoprotein YbaY
MPTNTSPSGNDSIVRGEVVFDPAAQPFSGAAVYIRLEDVSRADAAARVVGEQILPDVSYTAGSSAPLQFAVEGSDLDDQARYAVRVHVDIDGDGEISRGDYISMESYPVLTYGYPDQVAVRVQEVR